MVGAASFALIGLNTWMRGKLLVPARWDEWLNDPLPLAIAKEMLGPFGQSWLVAVTALGFLVGAVLASKMSRAGTTSTSPLSTVLPPVVLFVLAYLLALAVSLGSIVTDFPVFPRQWIGSVALAAPALVWLGQVIANAGTGRARITSIWLLAAAVVVALPGIVTTGLWKASQLRQRHVAAQISPYRTLTETQLIDELASGPIEQRRWVEFAEANLLQGGPVWPTFARYYTDTDWSTFVFLTDRSQLSIE